MKNINSERAKVGVYLLKKSFFARFLAHNTKNKQTKKARVSTYGQDFHHSQSLWTELYPTQNSYVGGPGPDAKVSTGGALGKRLGLAGVMGVGLSGWGGSLPLGRRAHSTRPHSALHVRMHEVAVYKAARGPWPRTKSSPSSS